MIPTRLRTVPPFVRFVACGGLAAGVNWASRFGWSALLPFAAATVAAYGTGMVTAFLLFRRFVFPDGARPVDAQVRGFVMVNIAGLLITVGLANLLLYLVLPAIGWTWEREAVAHGLAIPAPILSSWFGHRHLTFRA